MKFILISEGDNGEKPSPSFFPTWEVIIFVIIITLLLFFLLPKHLLEKTLANEDQFSAVTLSYLKAFSRIYPQDNQLTFILIAQEINLGQLHQAQSTIASLKKSPHSTELLNQIPWFDYLMLRYITYYKIKEDTPLRMVYLRRLRQMITALADAPLNPYQLRALAKDSLSLGEAGMALKIYNHLLSTHDLTTPEELAEGGNIAMQNNAHHDSAKFYWAAYIIASGEENKRKYALKTIQVLWAGNLVSEALSFADQLPDTLINDHDTLMYLSRLALAANRPDLARKYILKALITKLDH